MTLPLRLYAAGSLRNALTALLAAFSASHALEVVTTFGPAGLLSKRIEQGDEVDLFASANCAHPLRLKMLGLVQDTVVFTRNRQCIAMRNIPELTSQHWLSALCDPRFVLSTSTPGSDPGGDYAFQLFERIEQYHPGTGRLLRGKARPLVGGSMTHLVPPGMTAGAYLIRSGQSDIHIGYASYLPLLLNQSDLHVIVVPPPYNITAEYMLALMNPVRPEARLLADAILSPQGQDFLISNGFPALA